MGRFHVMFLEGDKIYACARCNTHLSERNEIISKEFMGGHGRAYLFNRVINITQGPLEDRPMRTGLHTVCDIYCMYCQALVGWKYERACVKKSGW